ncbi:hypothetical protein NP511_05705 [Natrinema thermotolerans]|uniref:Uncharacterized protein n=1 Tax=Natrinema thermotolerans TaxID=121872 RepID=A0AAF0PBN3_9EURY|nr:hypothetical protein [Natrinema thermotolerans]QCC60832.1 hypothetical protein DVR14_04995 [Natrinema thermotolerans]WMT09128.1 hypothetical protein NP511_05705 [Natrinema thermotolerans]
MSRRRTHAGDVRWGWTCPRCETDVSVRRDPDSDTFRWECDADHCAAVGFGFTSRRRARLALREYRERYQNVYR